MISTSPVENVKIDKFNANFADSIINQDFNDEKSYLTIQPEGKTVIKHKI